MNLLKTVAVYVGKTALRLLEVGIWSSLNSYTQGNMKDRSNILVRDIQQGVEHQGRKLRIIKNEK